MIMSKGISLKQLRIGMIIIGALIVAAVIILGSCFFYIRIKNADFIERYQAVSAGDSEAQVIEKMKARPSCRLFDHEKIQITGCPNMSSPEVAYQYIYDMEVIAALGCAVFAFDDKGRLVEKYLSN